MTSSRENGIILGKWHHPAEMVFSRENGILPGNPGKVTDGGAVLTMWNIRNVKPC
jgi:hypothetical protein